MRDKDIQKNQKGQNTLPELSQIKDTELMSILQRMHEKMKDSDVSSHAQETAKDLQKEIAPNGKLPLEQMWIPFCPMPTDMCRVSPFFPMSRKTMNDRPYIKDMIITSSSWGNIKYTGLKLSTYEEDVLMAVLAMLDSAKNRHTTDVEGKTTYTYRGPLLPILKLMGYRKVGSTDYKHVISALKLMIATCIELNVFKRTGRGKKQISKKLVTNILSSGYWDEGKQELTITINPYFYECYISGSITLLDVLHRSKLKSPISKALYRFIQSHRDNRWEGHFLTLASALNLDLNQPNYEVRRYIKRAINDLIKNNILSKNSGFVKEKKDVTKLIRIVKPTDKKPKLN